MKGTSIEPKEGDTFKIIVETSLVVRKTAEGKSSAKAITNLLRTENAGYSQFYNDNKELNLLGYETVTELLIQGLNANIHGAHQAGTIDSAKHLRHIISRLEELFVLNVKVTQIPINHTHIDD